jgi:hypothetical protein
MKLPEAQRALIAPAKIRDYLLSKSHPVGRFKEPFFASLGYSVAEWSRLEQDLLTLAASGDAEPGRESPYGQKYEIRGTLNGPNGKSAPVMTVWIVRSGNEVPQFVTAFPGEIE